MKAKHSALGVAIGMELIARERSTDEAKQPAEVVEMTAAEARELCRLDGVAFDPATPLHFMNMRVRLVDQLGPTRIKSRAEILLENRDPRPKGTVWLSTPSGVSQGYDRFWNVKPSTNDE